jgi:hypothetical protein
MGRFFFLGKEIRYRSRVPGSVALTERPDLANHTERLAIGKGFFTNTRPIRCAGCGCNTPYQTWTCAAIA